MVSEAQKRARDKYNSNNYTLISIRLLNSEAQALDEYVAANGVSKAGLIRRLIGGVVQAPMNVWETVYQFCLEHNTSPSQILLEYVEKHKNDTV